VVRYRAAPRPDVFNKLKISFNSCLTSDKTSSAAGFFHLVIQPQLKLFAGAGDREFLVIQQIMNPRQQTKIVFRVQPVSSSTLLWVKLRKLALPISQNMSRNSHQLGNFANRMVEFP
jgi:hypothetical protein